ncbi:MAG: NADH-quinone oxidoreductase subunit M [Bdellovibrio sp.]|nr:NADH-quinone oxidoreductase subunit M [Bdellovibrio sp.]
MAWFNSHLLTNVVFFPLLWAGLGFLIPVGKQHEAGFIKFWTFVGTVITFMFSVVLYIQFDPNVFEFQFIEFVPWIAEIGVSYHFGIDGISLWLILLTTFLSPIVILSSFSAIGHRLREYYFLLLVLESGMLGAFVSLDLFLFYVFWEVMLVPMYFLIGIWGGKERIYAALKFFLFTVVGSLLMLVAIFYLAYLHKIQFGVYSTSILDLYRVRTLANGILSPQALLFLAFALAFAVKVPMFPLHTWLPDAHVQAPTAGSVILAGVLLKMGGYGFIRFAFPLFPEAVRIFQGAFLILGTTAVLYGAWVSMVQPDIKKLVAYSSVSHMGFVIIGLFSLNSISVTGSIYQMLNHGISTGGLFLLVGILYERRHTREIKDFGGITRVMPLFSVAFMITALSSIALPGTNGFIGEFLILLGTWKEHSILAGVSALCVIFGAIYMLWAFQRMMFGPIKNKENETLKDLNFREIVVIVPIIICIFFMGIFPNFFFNKMNASVQKFLSQAGESSTIVYKSIPPQEVKRAQQ